MTIQTALDFLEPINIDFLSNDEGYKDNQIGKHIIINEEGFADISLADLVIVGCADNRGNGVATTDNNSPNAIRQEFYKLFKWHSQINIADVGNIKIGASQQDTYAALASVVNELIEQNKKVIILGGSHDVSLGQYNAYVQQQKIIEVTSVDATIDLNMESLNMADNFLMDLLTGEPNYVKHYTHIGFQSYLVHPQMLETIDKLRFDCYRVGHVKGNLEEMEPAIRSSNMFMFDIAAIQNAHAPANVLTPNGFDGEEACTLMQYAGMSNQISTIGIYGYNESLDVNNLTAKQISNMLWYIIDGIHRSKFESPLYERENFNEFTLALAEFNTTFLQSKKTGRWWMKTFDDKFIPCSKTDYLMASQNEMPERWLRYVERN